MNAARSTLEATRSPLDRGAAGLAAARITLDAGWTEYRQGLRELEVGKSALARQSQAAWAELARSKARLERGEEDYFTGLQDYWQGQNDADKELSDARRELNDARRDIADIEDCKWYVLDRETNMGCVSFRQDAQRMGNIADLFPSFSSWWPPWCASPP